MNTATGAGNELATSGIDDDLPGTFGLSIDHFSADDFALWILTE